VSVAVYVMPLSTWLSGKIRTTWGEGGVSLRRRSGEDVRRNFDAFMEQLEGMLTFRPEWDEEGPVQSATIFSLEGFSGPFLQARAQAYRRRLPILCSLEPPQIWIPAEFDPVLHLAAPWNPERETTVASIPRLKLELERLSEWIAEEDRPDLAEVHQVTNRLRAIAILSVEHRVPVIVEG